MAYLGNHGPSHSTESHMAASFEAEGHEVIRIQEGDVRAVDVPRSAEGSDILVWTQTFGLAEKGGTLDERAAMLHMLRAKGIPSVGFHLDRWHGLSRAGQLGHESFFRVDLLVTADGGHQAEWRALGIDHEWLPPGVYDAECGPGRPQAHYASDVAFVGSWQGYGHEEWEPARMAMLEAVRQQYGRRFRCWPEPRLPAVRGRALTDLYASTKVAVGDSCLAGGITSYWSDRVPETIGRGCLLIHPWVEGIDEHFTDGKHLRLYPLGDHAELLRLIGYYLEHEDERRAIVSEGIAHVRETATYRVRVRQIIDLAESRGLL